MILFPYVNESQNFMFLSGTLSVHRHIISSQAHYQFTDTLSVHMHIISSQAHIQGTVGSCPWVNALACICTQAASAELMSNYCCGCSFRFVELFRQYRQFESSIKWGCFEGFQKKYVFISHVLNVLIICKINQFVKPPKLNLNLQLALHQDLVDHSLHVGVV